MDLDSNRIISAGAPPATQALPNSLVPSPFSIPQHNLPRPSTRPPKPAPTPSSQSSFSPSKTVSQGLSSRPPKPAPTPSSQSSPPAKQQPRLPVPSRLLAGVTLSTQASPHTTQASPHTTQASPRTTQARPDSLFPVPFQPQQNSFSQLSPRTTQARPRRPSKTIPEARAIPPGRWLLWTSVGAEEVHSLSRGWYGQDVLARKLLRTRPCALADPGGRFFAVVVRATEIDLRSEQCPMRARFAVGHANAPWIDDANSAYHPVELHVGMSTDNDIGLRPSDQLAHTRFRGT